MTILKEYDAVQLAGALEAVEGFARSTGSLSMLDEASFAFGCVYETAGPAQQAFSQAHYSYRHSPSNETWEQAMTAARTLAIALRALGPVTIVRCRQLAQRPGRDLCGMPLSPGPCNMPLNTDGTCRGANDHV